MTKGLSASLLQFNTVPYDDFFTFVLLTALDVKYSLMFKSQSAHLSCSCTFGFIVGILFYRYRQATKGWLWSSRKNWLSFSYQGILEFKDILLHFHFLTCIIHGIWIKFKFIYIQFLLWSQRCTWQLLKILFLFRHVRILIYIFTFILIWKCWSYLDMWTCCIQVIITKLLNASLP